MRISDWSSDVCSSDLDRLEDHGLGHAFFIGDRIHDQQQFLAHLFLTPRGTVLPPPSCWFVCLWVSSLPACPGARRAPTCPARAPGPMPPSPAPAAPCRSEEHTSELQSLMRI